MYSLDARQKETARQKKIDEHLAKAHEVMDAPEMKTWDIVAVGDPGEVMRRMILRLADEEGVKFKVRVTSKQAITIAGGLLGAVVHIIEGKIIPSADEFPKREKITIGNVQEPGVDPSSLQLDPGSSLQLDSPGSGVDLSSP